MSQQPQPVETSSWKAHLNTIGLFIGTHGLAVFLVVFYTIYLYPRSEAERKEWIEQITRIRQIIEPETRALTSTQADAVLSIARRSFIQDLQHSIEFTRINGFNNYGEGWGGGSDSMHFWGEDFQFEYPKEKSAHYKELKDQLRKFNSIASRRQDSYRSSMNSAFEIATQNSEVLRYQLGRLRAENGSLDEVWLKASQPLRAEWLKMVDTLIPQNVDDYTVRKFQSFLEKNPDYTELSTKEPKEFETIQAILKPGVRTDVSPTARISSLFEQELAKALNAAYTKKTPES